MGFPRTLQDAPFTIPQKKTNERHTPRYKPPRLPLSIKRVGIPFERPNVNGLFFFKGSSLRKSSIGVEDSNKFRNAWLAHNNISPKQMVAIKHKAAISWDIECRLMKPPHANVVNLLAAFTDTDILFLVYEETEVSLSQVRQHMELEEKYISYICKEVLYGLRYLQQTLFVSEMTLSIENIHLTKAGCIKIANVGLYLLQSNQLSEFSAVPSVGYMMMELMEPRTASARPNVIVLMRPERWSREIRGFQSLTQRACIDELLCHIFIAVGISQSHPTLRQIIAAVGGAISPPAKRSYR